MAKVKLIYPDENVAVYGDSVSIRYETVDILSTDKVKKIVFKLDDNDKVETENLKGFYSFSELDDGDHTLSGYMLNDNNKKVKSSDFTFNFTTINKKYSPNKKISQVVAKKLPRFVQDDHPRFVKFVEAYYEWLESSNNPYLMNIASGDFFDIDKTPDIFVNQFRKQFLNDFPENFATNLNKDTANLKTVIKYIRQFYDAKGTEKSFKFFFRLLYDTFVEFYYPRNDILKASASRWIERKTIKLLCSNTELFHQLKSRIIYQGTTDNVVTFTARVSSVQIYKHEELTIAEINISSENGVFDSTQKVYCDFEDERITASVIEIINSIEILDGGFGYEVGDLATISISSTSYTNLTGKNAVAKVIKVGEKGNILKMEMTDTGSFPITIHSLTPSFNVIIDSVHGGNAILDPKYSGISEYPGYYSKKQGHISFNKKLQDNRRYQDLSYVLKTDMMLNEYIVLLKKLVHPAGFYIGGDIILKAEVDDIARSGNGIVREFRNLIGNFVAYRLNCDFDVRNFDAPADRKELEPKKDGIGDIFPNGFDPKLPIPEQTEEALNSVDITKVFIHEVGDALLVEGVSEVVYGNIPNVSDSNKVNDYWVVFPHPGRSVSNTDAIVNVKEFSQLTIKEFAINKENDVFFNLRDG